MSDFKCNESYVIGDLNGYWTIVEDNKNKYLVSKFNVAGSVSQIEFSSLGEAQEYILENMYANIHVNA